MSVILNDQAAQNLLDFSRKLDIGLLDSVVNCLYCGDPPQQRVAQQLLTQLKEHPDAWTRVDSILEFSANTQTKYYALQILEHVIKTRWKALPRAQCDGIKKYIVGLIIKTSSDPQSVGSGELRVYLGKLNMILVQILKFEWPTKWPTFISDIVGASKTNESLCQNNMVILKLLSEEVFDFSIGQMTQIKAKHLKDSMCTEFSQIFQLSLFVLENSNNVALVSATLETLLKFLNWIPLGYIFETKLIEMLVFRFLNVPAFRNITLKCLTEIAGVTNAPQYEEQLVQLFTHTVTRLKEMLPLSTNVREAYGRGQDDEQQFIQNLSLFLSTYLAAHAKLIERNSDTALHALLMEAHHLLLLISDVDETEIFKICLEYWNHLCSQLYKDAPFVLGVFPSDTRPDISRRNAYTAVLSAARRIMISRMAKPEEVLVVENEQGEVVREFMKDTDAINMYKSMRETLVYLTHLDYADTEAIMTEKLQKQVDGSEWSWKNLNTLCWAIGSISGAMHEEDERRFLVVVIKELLGLCEAKRGKDNKAIVASNIMYVVGQYPRFLRAHWKFLKTVVNKLFEFMHETHEGVQDMACDTFIKISHKCRKHFVITQFGEVHPFVDEILGNINTVICDLQPQQVHTFYEAVGMMIAAQADNHQQELLIEKLFLLPNQVFDSVILQATRDVDVLRDPEVLRQLNNILKTNLRACTSIGDPYLVQLGRIYLDMLNIYKVVSVNISNAIATAPPCTADAVMRQPLIKAMRAIKKDTLRLISCWVSKGNSMRLLAENMIGPLLEAVLLNYKQNIAAAREPEVLTCMSMIVTRLEDWMIPHLPNVFDAVFECTLEMINKDMEEFPEHRTAFFGLLEAITTRCFPALVQLNEAQFKLVLDSIVWAFKHTMRNVAETGLSVLYQLLQNFATMPVDQRDLQQAFFSNYYGVILHYLLEVISDSSHAGNLTMQATILSYMFRLVESGTITVGLGGNNVAGAPDNVAYVRQFLSDLLKQAFPHVADMQIKIFIDGLFSYDQDLTNFKEHVRDFLIQIREMTGEDMSDLYLEERDAQIRQAADDKRKQQMLVPGILGPHEVIPIDRALSTDDMND